jgi:hypothetical protein
MTLALGVCVAAAFSSALSRAQLHERSFDTVREEMLR